MKYSANKLEVRGALVVVKMRPHTKKDCGGVGRGDAEVRVSSSFILTLTKKYLKLHIYNELYNSLNPNECSI